MSLKDVGCPGPELPKMVTWPVVSTDMMNFIVGENILLKIGVKKN